MNEQPVKPEKITKPIQLLGAWLAGLLAIDSCFLFAAVSLPIDSWHSGALVIAAIANVPLFLVAVFLLQTRFRPELQEDSYYATYLNSKTNQMMKLPKTDLSVAELRQHLASLESKGTLQLKRIDGSNLPINMLRIGINLHLPDKAEIQSRLAELGVVGVSIFGSDDPPPGRNVAIAQRLDPVLVQRIAELSKDLGFNTYNVIGPEEDIDEDILFGSYGTPEFEIIRGGA
ncbi:hypothetical protein [Geothrix mesophila]|uniref:hypothetical protein n=1 Tax=Geothrix mesophila TaxID=2922723 RepID=UPI001FAE5D67|nr:hypothetical protein [Geothrix sp. SG198]